jgi:hypothetical protein
MATLAVYYDPRSRLKLDYSHMPHDVAAAMISFEGPPDDDEHLEALAQQLARLLLAQIKPN